MSKIIASAAIRGAHSIVNRAGKDYEEALEKWGPDQKVGFPNTAYYLPVIYGMLGIGVEKIGDMKEVIERCRLLLPPLVREKMHLPYLGPVLDAGMATLFADEIIEAIRYLKDPGFYLTGEEVTDNQIWLGAADDVILRKRGVEFVDGTAPGFAVILGSAPDPQKAKDVAEELQKKNLYVFMHADNKGVRFSEQLVEAGVQVGWPTRLVPFGPDPTSVCFAAGFAVRAAMSFGGLKAGEFRKILIYNKDRIFAFAMALGLVTDEWYAQAAGAINFGFPTIADTPIPEILPTGVCTYEHVVSNVPYDQLVSKAIEVRGLKVTISEVPVPVSYGPAFEGERVRKDDLYLECGGGKTRAVEWATTKEMNEVEDGKIELFGPDITDVEAGSRLPLAIVAEFAGRKMQDDFEPILERQIHHFINYAQGMMHIGQRDIAWVRIAKDAVEKGLALKDIGSILHAKFHEDFGAIFDKVQVKLYTEDEKVNEILESARGVYAIRDSRIEGMTDEGTDTFYSCTLCQSFAPSHVCIISPERTGLCGAYNWMDCKASNEINPTGPNQPVDKGECLDQKLGQWKGCNDFLFKASRGALDHYNFYSIVHDPMTTCGCCECIAAILPLCNGIMTVDRDFRDMTPCGMKFTTLAGTIGGGFSAPGFVGHGKYNITQRKWLSGDGGIKRLVWMPKHLKEEIGPRLKKEAEEMGVPGLLDMIADETVGTSEEEILPFLQEKGHPALSMDPLL
ncbi:MAG: CO dehydrogenase/CO-methylating acetyl-CoA synthase complex subunit beta [Deltaproteobacteria bacterium]|nr:CO dehydrogenase/CO-methylating acetyl-CoA synthase complex subunit beta [Deltaproteobacteria bacterium]MBW2601735.1 CO dehydrogenase/CO-methylating acetyl-CoA synthase complex subunit beta [Deltaproteobacteria bacterium]